ncbi:Ppx/GppA phosphatase family protein [Bacillus suaedae]|uniref:Ppx/GppA family phosphatase n=1 Tax=Halalkalibacter suaedae TaxID=2822140 RepID=A0A940WZ05_9BACI|nr:Ppx/GppA phosphatase family protein [Bacillus suaedae]MBP3951270.1 Ppx/GppA family phosphatase [Bacillus suaedae]
MTGKLFAIIDMGSNSIRLVINEIDKNGRYKELHNYKTVARLSSHINDEGFLTDNGKMIVVDTLKRFKEVIEYHNVKKVTTIATAAMRKAQNREEVTELIYNQLGFEIRILTEYEEAFYGYLAVVNSTNIIDGITVDIGGGSTEVTLFEDRQLKHYHSFPFGAVTLQQQFFLSSEPLSSQIKQIKRYILEQLQTLPWLKELKSTNAVIGIGGSARNLSLIHQRQVGYPLGGIHQYEFPAKDLYNINQLLQMSSYEERLNIDGLSKERADIIVPAAEVISSIVHYVGADTFVMSGKGLRDGVFYEEILRKMETTHFPNVAEESFFQLSYTYEVNIDHINQINYIAQKLYAGLSPYHPLETDDTEAKRLISQSARVLYIGQFINSEASSQNTFYLLTNMTIEGVSHQERLAIALISSFKSKSQMYHYAKPFKQLLTKKQLKLYEFLGAIMKLAYALDRTQRKAVTDIGVIERTKNKLTIPIFYQKDGYFEELYAEKNLKHLEKSMKKIVDCRYLSVLN